MSFGFALWVFYFGLWVSFVRELNSAKERNRRAWLELPGVSSIVGSDETVGGKTCAAKDLRAANERGRATIKGTVLFVSFSSFVNT